MSKIQAKIIADSINESGNRVTTFVLKYPRFVHSELMTHREFSRNAASSRAIPVKKTISRVWNDPAEPIFWGANQAGMSAAKELSGIRLALSKLMWRTSMKLMCISARIMARLGLHKQITNRIIEPWFPYESIVTATEYGNFFNLRLALDAQPEIRALAQSMWVQLGYSEPVKLAPGEWHMPFISKEELAQFGVNVCLQFSVARCARVSYLNHDGTNPDLMKDIRLYGDLLTSKHMSPFEHQARALSLPTRIGNFVGWEQLRKTIIGEYRPVYTPDK